MLFHLNCGIYRPWTAIMELFKAVNEQAQLLMAKSKIGGPKFDLACCLIMQYLDSVHGNNTSLMTEDDEHVRLQKNYPY